MKALLLTVLTVLTAAPALAQHAGHGEDERADRSVEQPKHEDPHAEHRTMPEPAQPAPDDPHSAHDMHAPAQPTEPPPQERHAGHDRAPPPADPHAGHDMTPRAAPPPPEAFAGPRHAADTLFDPAAMRAARDDLRTEHGDIRTWWLMADQVEAGFRGGSDDYLWDVQAWYGGDFNKIWLKSEGEGTFREDAEQAELQALWSRAITPWFDFQAGVRYDFRPQPERAHLVVGLQGLVPYKFELDATAFLSDEGDLTARFEAEYDQRITQRLLLQPRIELDLAAQEIPEIGFGSGLTSAEAGLRLRYEFAREFAPYIGVEYERAFGGTADFLRMAGEDPSGWEGVVGVRAWF
jgi:copper resistance protein B